MVHKSLDRVASISARWEMDLSPGKVNSPLIRIFKNFWVSDFLTQHIANSHHQIHSHQQALRQCRDYLAEHFWTRPLIEADDTAESARRLKEGKLPLTTAVIGSKSCADIYGLVVLQENIHDLKNNLTLFMSVKRFSKGSNGKKAEDE